MPELIIMDMFWGDWSIFYDVTLSCWVPGAMYLHLISAVDIRYLWGFTSLVFVTLMAAG